MVEGIHRKSERLSIRAVLYGVATTGLILGGPSGLLVAGVATVGLSIIEHRRRRYYEQCERRGRERCERADNVVELDSFRTVDEYDDTNTGEYPAVGDSAEVSAPTTTSTADSDRSD